MREVGVGAGAGDDIFGYCYFAVLEWMVWEVGDISSVMEAFIYRGGLAYASMSQRG